MFRREMFEMVQDGRLNPGVASGDYTLENFQQAYGDVEERKVRDLLLHFVLLPELLTLCLIPGIVALQAIGKIIIKCGGGGAKL